MHQWNAPHELPDNHVSATWIPLHKIYMSNIHTPHTHRQSPNRSNTHARDTFGFSVVSIVSKCVVTQRHVCLAFVVKDTVYTSLLCMCCGVLCSVLRYGLLHSVCVCVSVWDSFVRLIDGNCVYDRCWCVCVEHFHRKKIKMWKRWGRSERRERERELDA